jgi:transcription-repair coupling factor (superfamily II helicase)
MVDRFGPAPACVEDLFTTVRCRKIAVELGFERMTLKQKTLRCYFVNNPDSPYFESTLFQSILLHIQTKTNNSHLKQVGKNFLLVTEQVGSMSQLFEFLNAVQQTVDQAAS